MTYNNYPTFPYHLVDPSPWPILTSFALLTLTVSAVMYFHGYSNGGFLLSVGFILTASSMILWFRDVITEGTKINKFNTLLLWLCNKERQLQFSGSSYKAEFRYATK